MNKILPLLFCLPAVLMVSCAKGDYSSYSYNEETIFSNSDKTLFTEVMFFVTASTEIGGEKHYIFADNLRNLEIEVNGRRWAANHSERLDTVNLRGKQTAGIYRTTTDKVSFPFVINVRPDTGNPQTAGDYSDLLNNYVTLPPGSYLCRIRSFDIPLREGAVSTVYTPWLNLALEVRENTAATNLGNFEIDINR